LFVRITDQKIPAGLEALFGVLLESMSKEREREHKFNRQLIRLALFSSLAIFVGCSITEKRAQLPALVRTERQLAKAEKITSNPPEKTAEILSVARTVAVKFPKTPEKLTWSHRLGFTIARRQI
jgi:hypothetical protein